MAENTKIEWADHTKNIWYGCNHQHLGCLNCYAEGMSKRFSSRFGTWGPSGRRDIAPDKAFDEVRKWNRRAGKTGIPERVFWNDMSDLFEDRPDLIEPRRKVFQCVDECQNLIHIFCTKRPENIRRMWPYRIWPETRSTHERAGVYRPNVHLLYSASNQETLEAGWEHLRQCRDLSPVIGISAEPLIGPLDLSGMLANNCIHSGKNHERACGPVKNYTNGRWYWSICETCGKRFDDADVTLDWVIVGGESGRNRRPCEIEWFESIADQCQEAGVPAFIKQDSALKPGQQGRIPDRLWALKQFPLASRDGVEGRER